MTGLYLVKINVIMGGDGTLQLLLFKRWWRYL